MNYVQFQAFISFVFWVCFLAAIVFYLLHNNNLGILNNKICVWGNVRGVETYHSFLATSEIKNMRSYTSTSQYLSILQYLSKKKKLPFTLTAEWDAFIKTITLSFRCVKLKLIDNKYISKLFLENYYNTNSRGVQVNVNSDF